MILRTSQITNLQIFHFSGNKTLLIYHHYLIWLDVIYQLLRAASKANQLFPYLPIMEEKSVRAYHQIIWLCRFFLKINFETAKSRWHKSNQSIITISYEFHVLMILSFLLIFIKIKEFKLHVKIRYFSTKHTVSS